MSEPEKKRRGRPPGSGKKAVAPVVSGDVAPVAVEAAVATLPDVPARVETITALPRELASPDVAKVLDNAGFLDAARVIGHAIKDPAQRFRDEVRELCTGMPVTFTFESIEEAQRHEEIVKSMEPSLGRRFHPVRQEARLTVSLRPV